MEKFTVEKTNLCKGVAILIMLFHHLFLGRNHGRYISIKLN